MNLYLMWVRKPNGDTYLAAARASYSYRAEQKVPRGHTVSSWWIGQLDDTANAVWLTPR